MPISRLDGASETVRCDGLLALAMASQVEPAESITLYGVQQGGDYVNDHAGVSPALGASANIRAEMPKGWEAETSIKSAVRGR